MASDTLHNRAVPKTDANASARLPERSIDRIAYVMTWFPKLSETFVLREMIEMEKLGYQIEVFPLRKGSLEKVHPDAASFIQKAKFTSFLSLAILLANLRVMLTRPFRYFGTLWLLVHRNFGSRRYLGGALLYYPKAVYLSRLMAAMEIDHVHAHFASHPAMVAFVIHRFSGIPYSFTAHGSDLHRDQHMLFEKSHNASSVIAISNFNRNFILERCGAPLDEKVKVVRCGINTARFNSKVDSDAESGEKKNSQSHPSQKSTPANVELQLVCIGTLHEVKGQTHLIEACRILKTRGIPFLCKLVGGGPDQDVLLRQVATKGLESEIEFCGACTETEVAAILSGSDVLVCPSVPTTDGRREGIPVVLMEAMACSLPCVASDLSGIPEIVMTDVNGFLVPPGDSVAIANAVERLANQPDLRKTLSAQARETCHTDFDLTQNVRQLADTIESAHRKKEVPR